MTVIFGPTLSLGIDAVPASEGADKFKTAIDRIDSYGLRGSRSIDNLNKSFSDVPPKAAPAAKAVEQVGKSFSDAAPRVDVLKSAVLGFFGGLGFATVQQLTSSIIGLAGSAIQAADTFQNLDSRIRLVTDGIVPLTQAHKDLFAIAQQTSQSFEGTGNLFASLARNSKELGLSYEQLLSLTETVNQAVVISGVSAGQASAGLEQLGQAFASGRFQGDEFRTMMELFPPLAKAIADGLGVTVDELREMSEQGKLTAENVAASISSQTDVIKEQYDSMADTVGKATQRLRNEFDQLSSDILTTSNAHTNLISIINTLTEVLSSETIRGAVDIYTGRWKLLADILGVVGSAVETVITRLGKMSADAESATSKIGAASKALGNAPTNVVTTLGKPAENLLGSALGGTNRKAYSDVLNPDKSPIDKAITLEQKVTIKQSVTREVVSVKDGGYGPELLATGGLASYQGQVDRPVARPRGKLGYELPEVKARGGGRSTAESEAKRVAAEQERLTKQQEQNARQAYDTLSNLNTQYLQQLSSTLQSQDKLNESFDAEEKRLQVLRERELQHLDALEMSAEQKAQAIDLVNKRYALLTDAIAYKRGEAVLDQYKGNQTAAFGGYTNLEAGAQFPQIDLTQSSEQIDATFANAGDRLTEFGEKLLSMDNTVNLVTQSIAAVGSTAASAFADAIIEGESFADTLDALAKSLTKMLLTMTLQLAFQQALGGGAIGLGGLLGGGTTGATVAHGGGIVGRDRFRQREVPAVTFMGAPKLHQGGMTKSDEVPTILQKGEGVFTPGQMAAMGKPNVNVTVINNAAVDVQTTTREDANGSMQMEIMIDAIESAMANRMKRNGTTMNKAVRSIGDVRAR